MVIFSYGYLDSKVMISKLSYSWFIDPSEHHYTRETSKFNNSKNPAPTM